jgi:acetolactate synthase I/II/III large subunit
MIKKQAAGLMRHGETCMKLTGSEIVVQALQQYGIEYVAGIPGHGNWTLTDAFLQDGCKIKFIQVMHEQSAIHMADGYYRASGKPMAATTSVGPGATNTVIGMATAYTDSTSVFYINGSPSTHMKGHGVMQEIERQQENSFPRIMEEVSKRSYSPIRVEEIPFVMHRAFNTMLSGRPGPVHVELPMDLQCETADVEIHDLSRRMAVGVAHPDPEAVRRAVELLVASERPVICAGGGAITSNASAALTALAEKIGAAVSFTWNGKGAISEDHPLCAGAVGQTGTSSGNELSASADVVISVGCRFTDWSASSYAKGISFSFPPGKLIHIDLDHHEIGKNYPTEVGIVADARVTLEAILAAITPAQAKSIADRRAGYLAEIKAKKDAWEAVLAPRRDPPASPFTSLHPLKILREVLERDAIVTVGSGNTQGAVKQCFPVYQPRTHLTSGSFSPMGWAFPAALGAKLACPDKQVVAIMGDGDFMMCAPELGVAAMHNIPVVILVQNNQGYMSIRGGQRKFQGRHIGSEFNNYAGNGEPYSADLTDLARSFGIHARKVTESEDLRAALIEALALGQPALIEVMTSRDAAGPFTPGWWDFPSPDYYTREKDDYDAKRALEQHL